MVLLFIIHTGQDFESVLQNVKFDVGSRAGYTQCVHVNIISDGEAEGPEEFIFFIFVISFSSQQIQIVPERMIKIVTIIDGEKSTKQSSSLL